MSSARKILSSTLIQVLGKVSVGFFSLVTSIILAGYLTRGERGMYEFTYTFLSFAGIAADLGLYTIAIRELSKDKEKTRIVLGNILGIRLLLSILVVIGSLLVVTFVPSFQKGWGMAFTLSLGFAGMSTSLALMTGAMTSVLQVQYDMLKSTLAQIFGKVLMVLAMLVVTMVFFVKPTPAYEVETAFWAFQSLIIAGIVGNIFMCFYTWKHVRKYTKVQVLFHWEYWKKLIREALPYGFALVLATLYFKIDAFLLYLLLPKERVAEDLGLYMAAIKVIEIFSILPLFFLNASLPLLTEYVKEKSTKLQSLIQYSFDFLYLMALPIVVGGMILSREIVRVTNSDAYLTTPSFVGTDTYLSVLMSTVLLSFINLLFNFLLIAQDKQQRLVLINCVTLLFNIVTNILLIPIYGALAAAVTTVLSEVIVLLLTFYYASRGISFQIGLHKFWRITLAGIGMGGILFLVKPLFTLIHKYPAMLVTACVALVSYGGLLWLMRVVDPEMLKALKKDPR